MFNRNYVREANHARNGAAQEERHRNEENRMSVAKHSSGKFSLFEIFLRNGKKRFQNIYGRKYYQNNPHDQALMTEIYNRFRNPVDDEGRRWLEESTTEMISHNGDDKKVKERKKEISKLRRHQRHENPEAFQEQRTKHICDMQNQERITTRIPSKVEEVVSDQDVSRICGMNKRMLENSILAFIRSVRGVGNPICGNDFKVQVISVFPMFIKHKAIIGKLIIFPAEVAVATFDLVNGLISNESRFVGFDSKWAYEDTTKALNLSQRNDIEQERVKVDKSIRDLANILGSNELNRSEQEYPSDVYGWLIGKLNEYPGAKLVSSQVHFRYVYNALKLLSTYHGLNGKSYFAEHIASRLIPIEDLTEVILNNAPSDDSSTRSADYIREKFMEPHSVPLSDRSLDSYCEFHDNLRTHKKYNCMQAENARLIHAFFNIMEERRLQNFDRSPSLQLCYTDLSIKPVVMGDLKISHAKEPDAQSQAPPVIDPVEEEAVPDDEIEERFYSEDEDEEYDAQYDMTNRHRQTNNAMQPHYPHQNAMPMNISPPVQNFMVRSSDTQNHQENYYDNRNDQHNNFHYENHRNHDGRYGREPSNPRYEEQNDWSGNANMGSRTSSNLPRPSQNGIPAHFPGHNNGWNETWNESSQLRYGAPQQNEGPRTVERSPDRDDHRGHRRQQSNENGTEQPNQAASVQSTPYIENPTPDEFETPTISNYIFNAEESHSYLKMAKKSSTKTFAIINLQSVH